MRDSFPRNLSVLGYYFSAGSTPTVQHGSTSRTCYTKVRIYHEIVWVRQCKDEPLYELNRELTRMDCFLDVIVLHVGYRPDVAWIFCKQESFGRLGISYLVVSVGPE